MQAVGLEPLYRVPGVRVMPPLMPKPPSMLGGGGGSMGAPAQRGLGPMMRSMGGSVGGGGAGFGPSGSQHLMSGVGHIGMGGHGSKLGMQYGGHLPMGHMGGVGGPGHFHPHSGHGLGHGGMSDPYGGQGGPPAASPFAARHQQLASPTAGSDYGGGAYGSRGGSDVSASPGPRPGSEAHTPGRGPQSDQVRCRLGCSADLAVDGTLRCGALPLPVTILLCSFACMTAIPALERIIRGPSHFALVV